MLVTYSEVTSLEPPTLSSYPVQLSFCFVLFQDTCQDFPTCLLASCVSPSVRTGTLLPLWPGTGPSTC